MRTPTANAPRSPNTVPALLQHRSNATGAAARRLHAGPTQPLRYCTAWIPYGATTPSRGGVGESAR